MEAEDDEEIQACATSRAIESLRKENMYVKALMDAKHQVVAVKVK